eukprot:jgi/Mesvir1/26822/Mv20581-RA.1
MPGSMACKGLRVDANSGQDFTITADSNTLRFRQRDPDTCLESDIMTIDTTGRALFAGPRALWEFDNNALDTGASSFNASADTYATNLALPVPDTNKPYSSAKYIRGSHSLSVSRADEGVKLYNSTLNTGLLSVLNGDVSMSLWFQTTDNTATNQAIVSSSAEANFTFDLRYNNAGDGALKFFHSGGVVTYRGAAWTPTNGTWYHIVVTRSGNNVGLDQIASLYSQSASGTSLTSTIDISGLPAGVPTTSAPFEFAQAFEKTGGSNNFHHERNEERDANTLAPTMYLDYKVAVVGTSRGKAAVIEQAGQSYLRFTLNKFLPGTWTVAGVLQYDLQ